MLYGLTVHALWHAPIYGWLLLVSALGAAHALPLGRAAAARRSASSRGIAFGTSYFGSLLRYRVSGRHDRRRSTSRRQGGASIDRLAQLDPLRFLGSPGLWIGLRRRGVPVAVAVRLRRNREPI